MNKLIQTILTFLFLSLIPSLIFAAASDEVKTNSDDFETTIYTEEAIHRLVEIHYILGLKNEAEKYAEGEEVKLSGEALPALNKEFNKEEADTEFSGADNGSELKGSDPFAGDTSTVSPAPAAPAELATAAPAANTPTSAAAPTPAARCPLSCARTSLRSERLLARRSWKVGGKLRC